MLAYFKKYPLYSKTCHVSQVINDGILHKLEKLLPALRERYGNGKSVYRAIFTAVNQKNPPLSFYRLKTSWRSRTGSD
jgi:hypothetical protein